MHRLDLKQQLGSLSGPFLDLPSPLKADPDRLYLRQTERRFLPPSYRSGMAFFVTVMLLFTVGISAFDAHTLAQSRDTWMEAQLLREFSQLNQQLQRPQDLSAPTETDTDLLKELQQQSMVADQYPYWERSNHSRQLVDMSLQLRQGFEAFQHLLDAWDSAEGVGILEQIDWMRISGRRAYRFWEEVITQSGELAAQGVETEIPEFDESLHLIADLSAFLKDFEAVSPTLLHFLGAEEPQRVVLLISDSAQQRPTAGALSVGVELLLTEGKVYSSQTFHVADIDSLQTFDLHPPLGFEEITPRWNLSTANAFLDGKASAEQFHWFWQRQARSSLDLVLLMTTDGLERFLSAGWSSPLGLDPNHAQIENMSLSWTARIFNGEVDDLKALADQLVQWSVEVFADPDRFFQAWPTLQDLTTSKQLLLMASDPEQQALLSEAGLSGELPNLPEGEDVLMVASLNEQSNGSDRWVEQSLRLHTAVQEHGAIKHWLQINRDQLWSASQSGALRDAIPFPLATGTASQLTANNRSLMRVVVPFGSQLLGSNGVKLQDVSTQHLPGFTIWSFPMQVSAGGRSTVELEYELPWSFATDSVDNYRLHLLQQPGAKPSSFAHQFKVPADLSVFQELPADPIRLLDQDQTLAIVAGKNPS